MLTGNVAEKIRASIFSGKVSLSSKRKYTRETGTANKSKFTEGYCAKSLYKHHAVMLFFKQKIAQII